MVQIWNNKLQGMPLTILGMREAVRFLHNLENSSKAVAGFFEAGCVLVRSTKKGLEVNCFLA